MAAISSMSAALNRFRTRSRSIRAHLLALIAVIVLPLLGLSGWLAANRADAERRVIEARRFDMVNSLSFLVERELTRIEGILTGLAASPDLAANDLTAFRRGAIAAAQAPGIGAIVLYDQTGQQLVSTRVGAGQPLPSRDDLAPLTGAFEGQVVVSNVVQGAASQRPIVIVSVPVYRDGSIVYALAGSVVSGQLNKVFNEAGVPPAWTSAVVDRNGRFVTRSLNPERYAGEPARPELGVAAGGAADIGEFENVTLEGVRMANSFHRSSITGWTSVVAVPKDVLNAPLRQTMAVVLAWAVSILVLSLAAALLLAQRISLAIRGLSGTALAFAQGRPFPNAPGGIVELVEVRTALEAAVGRLSQLAAIVFSSGDAIVSLGLDGHVLTWNPGAERLWGYAANEIAGQSATRLMPADRALEVAERIAAIQSGEPGRSETIVRNKNGELIPVSLDIAPIRDSAGIVASISMIARDMTDRKRAEDHQRFLLHELTHRSKNLLTVINALAGQTANSATSLNEFRARFTQRIQGLAASHDLLVSQKWTAASLAELVRRQLAPFLHEGASPHDSQSRLQLVGPEVHVGVEAAQALGLALHELATNSVKYGALSAPSGTIRVEWTYVSGNDAKWLSMSWQERGGPAVTAPTRKGFGTVVIEKMVAQSLDGSVTMDYAPEGLTWTILFPASHILAFNDDEKAQDRAIARAHSNVAQAI